MPLDPPVRRGRELGDLCGRDPLQWVPPTRAGPRLYSPDRDAPTPPHNQVDFLSPSAIIAGKHTPAHALQPTCGDRFTPGPEADLRSRRGPTRPTHATRTTRLAFVLADRRF